MYDQDERIQALNPQQSYIIQAPAGSGKTELLIQRYLTLLSIVDHSPEEIIALTFTRKAASEMRSRILDALLSAQKEKPAQPYKLLTWELAKRALKKDETKGWHILTNPKRLRIATLDSFCAYLTRQMPILAQFGAQPTISDNPLPLYQEAVQRVLASLETDAAWINALEHTLLHLGNDYAKAEKLLIQMLARREQWLPYISSDLNAQASKERLETALQQIALDALQQAHKQIPTSALNTLIPLLNFAALHLGPDHPLSQCHRLKEWPEPTLANLALWQSIADWLLTKTYEWRKKPDKKQGFPSPNEAPDKSSKQLFKTMKQQMQCLLESCQANEDWRQALEELCKLPPCSYADNQWETIYYLTQILKITAAHLQLIFQEKNIVDYSEIAIRAIQALGSPLIPSDLALLLDQQINHILVDEFQDTSVLQVELLQHLTAGWQAGDGKTLFIVGDPMQSIYRFRKAEVGLFLRAQRLGIGNVALVPLILKANFRSQPAIIDWINHTFQAILPQKADLLTGAVPFSSSLAMQAAQPMSTVSYYAAWNSNEEALQITQLIQAKKGHGTIAILVRSKNHLTSIIPALRNANIPYRALEMTSLKQHPVTQDLLALTKALLHPEDKLAWLAVLRAPWCGLTLSDLYQITNVNQETCLWENILQISQLKLTKDGQRRIIRFKHIIEYAISQHARTSLALWVEETWLALGGLACLKHQHELEYVNAFFDLLQAQQQAEGIHDFNELEMELERLYASSHGREPHAVEIMTIHKAKGLEFDSVILPSLHRSATRDQQPLLLWMERPRSHDGADLLLASIKEGSQKSDPIYTYLQQQEEKKQRFEIGRLLYVAATRAKQSLHLFTCLTLNKFNDEYAILNATHPLDYQIKKPFPGSFLELLWPLYANHFIQQLKPIKDKFIMTEQPLANHLYRLPCDWQTPIENNPLILTKPFAVSQSINLETNPTEIIIKRILASMAKRGIVAWQGKDFKQYHSQWSALLTHLGVLPQSIKHCLASIEQAVSNILNDRKTHWFLTPQYAHSHVNYALTAYITGKVVQMLIDRTFIDNHGIRWIILYRISKIAEGDNASYAEQINQCHSILNLYGQAMEKLHPCPTQLGLYLPLSQRWLEWDYISQSSPCYMA